MATLDTVTGADVKVYSQAGPASYAAGGFLLDASADFSWLGMLDVTVDSPSYLNIDGLNSWASTPDDAALDVTGDISMRWLGYLPDWTPAVGGTLICKGGLFLAGDVATYCLFLAATGLLGVFWSPAPGTAQLSAFTAVATGHTDGTYASVRADVDVNDGAGNRVFRFYTKAYDPTVNPRTQLESAAGWTLIDTVTVAGVTDLFAGTGVLHVGADANFGPVAANMRASRTLAAVVRNDGTATVVANPDFSIQIPGDDSFVDAAGRTWTCDENAFIDSQLGGFDIEQDINVDLTGAEAFGKGVVKVVSQRYDKATVSDITGAPGGVTVRTTAGQYALVDAHVHSDNHDHAAATSAAPTAAGSAVNSAAGIDLLGHTHVFDVPAFVGSTASGAHSHQFSFEYDHDHSISAPTVTDVAATELATATDLRAVTFRVTAYGFGDS